MEMKNDFAKSILDSPYNKITGGKEVTLMDILSKYNHQRSGEKLEFYEVYAEDLGITKEEALAYQNWINDGKPTGIESDEQSYELEKQIESYYRSDIYRLCPPNRTKNLLLKYWCQQAGITIDNGRDFEEHEKLIDWINNGEPTGISTADEFYALQEKVYGRIVQTLYMKPLHRIKGFYISVNHYKKYDFDKVLSSAQDTDVFNQKNVPWRCTPYFLIDGFCTLEHLEKKSKEALFQKLTDGIYGLNACPEKMYSIVCDIFSDKQRLDMLRSIHAFSDAKEIILVAYTKEIPFTDDLQDYFSAYHIAYFEDPFYDKVRELERLSTFYSIYDIGLRERRKKRQDKRSR